MNTADARRLGLSVWGLPGPAQHGGSAHARVHASTLHVGASHQPLDATGERKGGWSDGVWDEVRVLPVIYAVAGGPASPCAVVLMHRTFRLPPIYPPLF